MNGREEHRLQRETQIAEMLRTMPPYMTQYYLWLANDSESTTCSSYLKGVARFLSYLNKDLSKIDLNTITESDVSGYLFRAKHIVGNDGDARTARFSTQKTNYFVLNNFFTYLHRSRLIAANPMELMKPPRNHDTIKRRKINSDEVAELVLSPKTGAGSNRARSRQYEWRERDTAILTVFLTTGMRKTALTEINVEDICDGNLIITDKRSKQHVYQINSAMQKALDDWIAKRRVLLDGKQCDALFISNRRTRIGKTAVDDIVAKYSKEAIGREVSPHKLRAAFIDTLMDKTGNIELVRSAVGHSSIQTTQRYVTDDGSSKRVAADIMNDLLG